VVLPLFRVGRAGLINRELRENKLLWCIRCGRLLFRVFIVYYLHLSVLSRLRIDARIIIYVYIPIFCHSNDGE